MAQSGDESNSNRDRIEWLAEQIAYHSDLYYNQAKTEISDAEFVESRFYFPAFYDRTI